MCAKKDDKGDLIAKYKELLPKRGGIFTAKMRGKLLGYVSPGRETIKIRRTTDFRYDVREQVRKALADLEFFIEVASKEDIIQVMTYDNLGPVVKALMIQPLRTFEEPDAEKAHIAQLFVKSGFGYLGKMKGKNMTKSNMRTIEEALDLSRYLAESFKAEESLPDLLETLQPMVEQLKTPNDRTLEDMKRLYIVLKRKIERVDVR